MPDACLQAFHVRSAMVGLLAFAIMVWFDDPSGGGHAVDQLEQRSDVGLVAHHTARHNRCVTTSTHHLTVLFSSSGV